MSDPAIKLPRHSKGKRPYFFDDPAIDQMMTFLVELTAEVSVVYDRLDTVERLLESKGTISRKDIKAYRASGDVEAERMTRRDKYLKRVFRMHQPQATYGKSRAAAKPASAPAAKKAKKVTKTKKSAGKAKRR